MPVEIQLNTPLAEALNGVVQPKLQEVGWANESDVGGLSEYIILMLVNGNSEEQIGSELASDLLNLPSDDPTVREFSKWLFKQIDTLNAQLNGGQAAAASEGAGAGEMDTDMNANDVSELNAPTGPRSMRNGNDRGGRDKRMLGHMNKAMGRTDGALHRVRGATGNERINTHGRGAMGRGGARGGRGGLRAANIQAGLAAGGANGQWMMQGQQPPNQMELMAMLEQQNQMMFQLSQQLMNGGPNQHQNRRGGGKSLFERTGNNKNFRKGQHNHNSNTDGANGEKTAEGDDVDMGGERPQLNPDETVCKYNLRCTNKDCSFAHQSPAAPPGTSIDVNDSCSFGAACKNRKCVARHPSPAARTAHQSEQDCKFFPNCQNPRCPFKHPAMPLCRNGADCTTADCKFTHVKTKCRFNPCLNPNCAFQHEAGQQGGFKDKVWTAEGGEHVSDRKFVDEATGEETVRPDEDMKNEAVAQETDVIG